jgi:hypothetical protein
MRAGSRLSLTYSSRPRGLADVISFEVWVQREDREDKKASDVGRE